MNTNKPPQEKRQNLIFRFSMTVSVLMLLIVLALVSFQTYIRWFVNQNFTLVGGNELEVMTASVFVLITAITYINRPSRVTE